MRAPLSRGQRTLRVLLSLRHTDRFCSAFHLGWTAVDSVFDLATSLVADDRIAALFCSEVTAVAIYFIFISGQQLGCFCGVMDICCCCLHGMNQSAVPVNADMCLIAEVPGIAFLHLMCIRVPLLFLILGGRRGGNNGGIHDRSLFRMRPRSISAATT